MKAYDNFCFKENNDKTKIIKTIESKDFASFDENFIDLLFLSIAMRILYSYEVPNVISENDINIIKKNIIDKNKLEKDLEENTKNEFENILELFYTFKKNESHSFSFYLEDKDIKKKINDRKENHNKEKEFDLDQEIKKYLILNNKKDDEDFKIRKKIFGTDSELYKYLKEAINQREYGYLYLPEYDVEDCKLCRLKGNGELELHPDYKDYLEKKISNKFQRENDEKCKKIEKDFCELLNAVFVYCENVYNKELNEQFNADIDRYIKVYDEIYLKLKKVINNIESLLYKKEREEKSLLDEKVSEEKSLLDKKASEENEEILARLEKEIVNIKKEIVNIRAYIAGLSTLLYTLYNIRDCIDIKKDKKEGKYQYKEYFYVPFLLSDDVLLKKNFCPDFQPFYFKKNFLPNFNIDENDGKYFNYDNVDDEHNDEKKKELIKSIMPEYLIIEHAENNKNIKYSFDDLKSKLNNIILDDNIDEDDLDNFTNKKRIYEYLKKNYEDIVYEEDKDDINKDEDKSKDARQDFYGKLELADCFCQLEDVNILKARKKDKARENAFCIYINFHENIENLYHWLCINNKNFGYFSKIKKKYSDYIDSNLSELKEYWSEQIKNKYKEGSSEFKDILDFLKKYKNYSAIREFLENNEKIYKYENLNDFLFKYVEKPNFHDFCFERLGKTGEKKINRVIEYEFIEANEDDKKILLEIAEYWEDIFSTIDISSKLKTKKLLSFLGFKVKENDIKDGTTINLFDRYGTLQEIKNFEVNFLDSNISNNHQFASFIPSIFKNGFRIIFVNYDFKFKHDKIEHFIDFSIQDEIAKKHTIVFYNDKLKLNDRRELSMKLKLKKIKNSNLFLIIDRVVILFLLRKYFEFYSEFNNNSECGDITEEIIKQIEEKVNDCLMSIILPFGYYQPYYSSTSGKKKENKEIENKEIMFVGREVELDQIKNPIGPFMIVYGGRQLGKTLLLKQAEKEINREKDSIAIYIRLKDIKDYYGVLHKLSEKLEENNIVNSKNIGNDWNDFKKEIKNFLDKPENKNKKIYLFLDEIDGFITSCKNFVTDTDEKGTDAPFEIIRGLSDDYGKQFNVVFAGLNLYVDFKGKNAFFRRGNDIASQLEKDDSNFILIEPFKIKDAVELIERPLHNLGLDFSKDLSLIYLILYNTNYYPCLIQMYCKNLLESMSISKNYEDLLYSNGPIYYIKKEHIYKLLTSKDFTENVRKVFYGTLELDSNGGNRKDNYTFKYLANILALLCYTNGYKSYELSDFIDLANGSDKDIGKIEEICKLKKEDLQDLLDLLVKLSVFEGDTDKGYRFNRFSLFKLIGETEKDIRDNLKHYINEDFNKQ